MLGERQALKGFVGSIPDQIEPGDTLHILNMGGVVGLCHSANSDFGQPMRVRVLGAAIVDGQPANIGTYAVPWQDEQLSVAVHKPNVYIDLSGWSPKYFEPKLVQYMNTLLKHKVLFGSDFPLITPDRWFADFEKLEIKPEVRPLILKENAAKLLKLN